MARNPEPKWDRSDVLRMFPTFVWKAELRPDDYAAINISITRKLGELEGATVALMPGENWQSDQALNELDEFRRLVDCVNDAAESVLNHLKIVHDGFKITGCWANISAPGAAHHAHSHPNNYLSGVYYVRTHKGADTINFHDPRPQTGIIRPPVAELTAENTEQVVVKVKDGTLLIFPGWLEHSVDPNRSDQPRVSISFNIMFSSYAESMSTPFWTSGKRGPV